MDDSSETAGAEEHRGPSLPDRAAAAVGALRSAPSPLPEEPIRVENWLVLSFLEGLGRPVPDETDPVPAGATGEFLAGLQEAVVLYAEAHGVAALAALVDRLRARLANLEAEYERAVQLEAERSMLYHIVRLATRQSGQVLIADKEVADWSGSGLHVLRSYEFGDFDDEAHDEIAPVAGRVVAVWADGAEPWEGDLPGHTARGPVPVERWVRDRVDGDPSFDPEDWTALDVAGSLERYRHREACRRDALGRSVHAVEVEASVATRVLDAQGVDQATPLDEGQGAGRGAIRPRVSAPPNPEGHTVADDVAHRRRLRKTLLLSNRDFFLAALAELIRTERARSVATGYDALVGECSAGSDEPGRVPYQDAKYAEKAFRSRLGVNASDRSQHGYEAIRRAGMLSEDVIDFLDEHRHLLLPVA